MPIIPLLPSDSAAVVEYKIYLSAEADLVMSNALAVQKWRLYHDGPQPLLIDEDKLAFLGNVVTPGASVSQVGVDFRATSSIDWPIDNMCKLVVNEIRTRLNVVGLKDASGAEHKFDEATGTAPVDAAIAWWKEADLDLWEGPHYGAALRDEESYLLVDYDSVTRMPRFTLDTRFDGSIGIRVRYENPALKTRALYATRFWRTADPTSTEGSNILRQTVYTPLEVRKYVHPTPLQAKYLGNRIVGPSEDADGWYPIVDAGDVGWPIPWTDRNGQPLGVGVIPFVSPRGSVVQAIIGLQNSLNKTNLDLMALSDQQGFGMVVAKYANGLPPDKNSSGTEIDPAGDGLGFRPGRVLETTADVSKLPADDMAGMLAYKTDQTVAISRNSGVPLHRIIPQTGAPPSGAALRMLESGLVTVVEECQVRFGSAWRQVFDLAQKLEGAFGSSAFVPVTLNPSWKPAQVQDPSEDALSDLQEAQRVKAYTDAGLPLAAALRKVGWQEEEIAKALADKATADAAAQESMATALLRQQRAMEAQTPDGTIPVDVPQNGRTPAVMMGQGGPE